MIKTVEQLSLLFWECMNIPNDPGFVPKLGLAFALDLYFTKQIETFVGL